MAVLSLELSFLKPCRLVRQGVFLFWLERLGRALLKSFLRRKDWRVFFFLLAQRPKPPAQSLRARCRLDVSLGVAGAEFVGRFR